MRQNVKLLTPRVSATLFEHRERPGAPAAVTRVI